MTAEMNSSNNRQQVQRLYVPLNSQAELSPSALRTVNVCSTATNDAAC